MKAIAWIAGVDQDDELELRRWLFAALAVAAVHAGLLAAHLWWPASTSVPGADAPPLLIDFAPEAAAPESKADLAPDKEESVESQAAPQKQAVQKVEDQPIIDIPPIQTPEPELVIPPKQEVKKEQPQEEKPTPAVPTENEHPQAHSAPVTTSNPNLPNRAEKAVAPNPGSAAAPRVLPSYRDLVAAHLQRFKRAPKGGGNGTAVVSFMLDRSGRVTSQSISRSSGSSALDDAALAMISRANPMPRFPAAMSQESVSFTVPIRYR
jgi:periplasmic protein TonB